MAKSNIFTKIVMLILSLLVPVIGLYFYSNHVSGKVAFTEIKRLNNEQLSFFVKQLEADIDHLSVMSMTLSREPSIRDFKTIQLIKDPLDYINVKEDVLKTIELQRISNNMNSDIVVYSPNSKELISTTASTFGIENIKGSMKRGWNYHNEKINGLDQKYFTWYMVEPWSAHKAIETADLIIAISFSENILIQLLDQFKSSRIGDPFFYHKSHPMIMNRTADYQNIREVVKNLNLDEIHTEQVIKIKNKEFLLSYVQSEKTGWYIVDYVPLDTLISPIQSSRIIFYTSVICLLISSIVAAFMLYLHVQLPVNQLVHGVNSIKKGDYSVRIVNERKNEFGFLIKSFNEMAKQIQTLIESVYEEKVRSKDAVLKQLQSQINPHFLYNSLFFIKNMIKLNNEKASINMIHNLSEYYRYTTRVDEHLVDLKEEIDLIENYLNIYTLRMDRISYNISIPKEMMEEKILRLILQPVVENAIIHGIEPKLGKSKICITGKKVKDQNCVSIEDNGVGMTSEEIDNLKEALRTHSETKSSYGLWNINQRLLLQFGKGSGINIEQNQGGGLRVNLYWNRIDRNSYF